jgi:hypothetical protein
MQLYLKLRTGFQEAVRKKNPTAYETVRFFTGVGLYSAFYGPFGHTCDKEAVHKNVYDQYRYD